MRVHKWKLCFFQETQIVAPLRPSDPFRGRPVSAEVSSKQKTKAYQIYTHIIWKIGFVYAQHSIHCEYHNESYKYSVEMPRF